MKNDSHVESLRSRSAFLRQSCLMPCMSLPLGKDLPSVHLLAQAKTLGVILDASFPWCSQLPGSFKCTSKRVHRHKPICWVPQETTAVPSFWVLGSSFASLWSVFCIQRDTIGKIKQNIKKTWKLVLESESILCKFFKVFYSLYLRFMKIAPSYIGEFLT